MRALFFLACFLPAFAGMAQNTGNTYVPDTSIRVMQGGQQRTLAWCGGFSNPQFASADLNNDGLKDLVIFEAKDRWVRTFINRGSATAAAWEYAPRYAANFYFPTVRDSIVTDYLKLEDYNRDGIADLIQKGPTGFAIYKGYYNSSNELSFKFFKELFYTAPGIGLVNAYTQASDIPGVADVDGDGDLDFFGYDISGGLISWFKNCQVEHGLSKDSIEICNPTRCWGHVFQGVLRTFVTGISPSGTSGATCPTLGTFDCIRQPEGYSLMKETRHLGNCILVFDYDGDGDMDLLDGNLSYADLQFLRNGRAQNGGTDSMVAQDTLWQSGGRQVFLPPEPSAFYIDGDGDGKRDLMITPHDANNATENYRTIQMYKNTGSAASPVFTYQSDTFLVDKTIDAGSASYPVLYDYNKDGKLDLFVGSAGYYQTGGTYRSRISYYQNGGPSASSTLTYVTNDFGGLSALNVAGAAPAFGDLDGDGKDDMVIGHTDGTLSFYKNNATSNLVTPQWTLSQLRLKSAAGDTINVNGSATPYIYDINRDGKPDLLIGNVNGRIAYYSGAASGSGPMLTFVTASLGGVLSDTANAFSGYSSIWIGKMDNTNTEYLLTGNDRGWIVRYTGFQSGNVTTPYTIIDGGYSGIRAGGRSSYENRSTVAVGDIDGDGRYEMIVGSVHGGLNLYRQGPKLGVPEVAGAAGCSIAPNPAKDAAVVRWDANFAAGREAVRIALYNAVGQLVVSASSVGESRAATIPLAGLPAGIYVCRVQNGQGKGAAIRLSVMR